MKDVKQPLIKFDGFDYKLINNTLEELEKDVCDIVNKEEQDAEVDK